MRTREESNLWPFGPEPNALSTELRVLCALRRDFTHQYCVLGRNRTCDLLDRNQTLYPLSYKDNILVMGRACDLLDSAKGG